MTRPPSSPRAAGLGNEQSCSSGAGTVSAGCDPQCLASPPRATAIPPSPLASSLWQTGCFSCRSQCSGNCPKLVCDNGTFNSFGPSGKQAAALQSSAGTSQPGESLGTLGRCWWVWWSLSLRSKTPSRTEAEPEGQSCYSHSGWTDRHPAEVSAAEGAGQGQSNRSGAVFYPLSFQES